MSEARDTRLRRLAMRSMRRGIKEMDLILGDFSRRALDTLPDDEIEVYEQLLEESDHDLYQWVSGQTEVPRRYHALIARIADGATGIVRPA